MLKASKEDMDDALTKARNNILQHSTCKKAASYQRRLVIFYFQCFLSTSSTIKFYKVCEHTNMSVSTSHFRIANAAVDSTKNSKCKQNKNSSPLLLFIKSLTRLQLEASPA